MRFAGVVALCGAVLWALAAGCTLEWPRVGPTPCGDAGQRCCEALDDAGAAVSEAGCVSTAYCVATDDAGAGVCRACRVGLSACDNRCVDLTTSVEHCGRCGVTCRNPTPRCVSGGCR